MKQFLEWWVLFLLQLAGLALCQYFDMFRWVWEKDITKLSYVILSVWLYFSIYCGSLSWKLCKKKLSPDIIAKRSDIGWFFSDICFALGLLGTVAGFLVMMGSISLAAEPQAMLKQMAIGMSTAMITTLLGIGFGNLLKLQFFFLTRET